MLDAAMSTSVEELSASLVREFLSRKGLKMTLAQMDKELPRISESISNRVALTKAAHIERLMKKNKELSNPYRTMIEVIVKFLIERSSSSEHRDSITGANLTTAISPAKKETGKTNEVQLEISRSLKQEKVAPKLSLTLQSDTAVSMDPSATALQYDFVKESERHGKTLKQQRSISEGILKKQVPESQDRCRAHHSRRSSATAATTAPVVGGTSRHRMHGNPLTESLDATLSGKTLAGANLFISEKEQDNIAERKDTIRLSDKPRPGKQNYTSHRKDPAFFSSQHQPATTTIGLGARTSRHHKFKPRGPIDLETTTELETPEAAPLSLQQRESRLLESKKLLQDERPFVRIPVAEWEKEDDADFFGSSGRKMDAGGLSSEVHRGMKSARPLKRQPKSTSAVVQVPGELLCEDLEDLDFSFETTPMSTGGLHRRVPTFPAGKPITLETAKSLRELLFGSAKAPSFNSEWKRQNLFFCDVPHLEYGLVQHKGGPCGVLACIQAHVLKHLLFTDREKDLTKSLRPSPAERSAALAAGMADILWRAGGGRKAIVTLPSTSVLGATGGSSYRPDQLTERLVLHEFSDHQMLKRFLHSRLAMFQDESSSGCILILYSVMLSRGTSGIRQDMDEKEGRLVGAHGYCTQEMVNLLLVGFAVSNLFDGNLDLDSGGSNPHILKGVPEQSEVGLLSLFEHYGACTVGGYYKEPVLPIWVVCSESHFTVLFSLQRNLLKDRNVKKRFDLYYYDGLANQDEPIRLTIDPTHSSVPDHSDLIPPLELCIQTKWENAAVNWNGTEPLL